eukprot:NODE_3639_length_647_cov_212.959866_g2605_i0.p2 GENE.NODE_3639_length_647_cov_212.959866_g2605_i0~~NODE_3639_length_647_cov_212.959866_g2605_i0.p2  ORF type:complete len:186 (-),score=70.16 NODE_3639_length_647_cov_212.959866_g2605_i0:57-614(-)
MGVSDCPTALAQARQAVALALQQINRARAARGLRLVEVTEQLVKQRRQALSILREGTAQKHLVVFVSPGSCVRKLDDPRDGSDFKYLYSQVNEFTNAVMMFVVGPLSDPRFSAAGNGQRPVLHHGQLADPLVRASGLLGGDGVGLRLLRDGQLLSFVDRLNPAQVDQLEAVLSRLESEGTVRVYT